MTIVVCLPIRPGLVTLITSRVPAANACWKRATRVTEAVRTQRRAGQALPRQRTAMRAPRGARTVSSVTRAPERVRRPRILTTGVGSIMRTEEAFWVPLTSPAGAGARGTGAAGTGAVTGSGCGTGRLGSGDGSGEGSGSTVTAAVEDDSDHAQPSSLRTDSRTRRYVPRSACETAYEVAVAPAMAWQLLWPGDSQRSHCQVATDHGTALQAAQYVDRPLSGKRLKLVRARQWPGSPEPRPGSSLTDS